MRLDHLLSKEFHISEVAITRLDVCRDNEWLASLKHPVEALANSFDLDRSLRSHVERFRSLLRFEDVQ